MVQTSPWKDVLHAGTPPPMPAAIFGMATAFQGVALYLVLEINATVFRRFKKRKGLYFWSLLISSWGVCLHTLGYILQWWTPKSPWILNTACILSGWSMMVTAQSLVLYSRLHLVVRNYNILRGVLIMIIATAIIVEIPQWVTTWASTDTKLSVTRVWSPYDSIMVRISQLAFLILETTISVLYIWGTVKVFQVNDKVEVRRVKWDLIYINTYIVLVDIVILVLAYTNEHFPKEPIQNFAYAFKLKIEFVVLNQLMTIMSQSRSTNLIGGNRYVKSSSSSGSVPQVTRSKPSTDGQVASPGAREHHHMANFAHGPKSPLVIERLRSGSSGENSEVKSPSLTYANDSRDYMNARSRRQEEACFQHSKQEEAGVPFHEFGSKEDLTPKPMREEFQDEARPSPMRWWLRLWSMIPSSEDRLRKDMTRI